MDIKNKKKFAEIKIWRIDNNHRFTTKDDYIFTKIKPHLHNAIKNIYQKNQTVYKNKINAKLNQTYLSKTYALTSREAQVTLEILKGKKDEKIANTLHIAFSTLRTHLKHIFSKLKVNSRALLLHRIYLDISLVPQSV
jgi:DNA-binding NarL/FixJ family response regulator